MLTRRTFVSTASLGALAPLGAAIAPATGLAQGTATAAAPRVLVASDKPANGVCAGAAGIFLGMPRFAGHTDTPSLARALADGQPQPFPGNAWNAWRPGDDGRQAFVCINSLRLHGGDLWLVDQGKAPGAETAPEAQKLLRLDPSTGEVRQAITFGPDILPEGATMNDLRISGDWLYVTDSGLGGVIVRHLPSGRTRRRLSGHPLLREPEGAQRRGWRSRPMRGPDGGPPDPTHADMLEVSPDRATFYWATPTGPLYRIPTAALLDEGLDDAALAGQIARVAEIPNIGGTGMDSLGNLYLSDIEGRKVTVIAPDGRQADLVQDERLKTPDALFITSDRQLLIPCAQLEYMGPWNGGQDATQAPFEVFSLPLPETLGGIRLGGALG